GWYVELDPRLADRRAYTCEWRDKLGRAELYLAPAGEPQIRRRDGNQQHGPEVLLGPRREAERSARFPAGLHQRGPRVLRCSETQAVRDECHHPSERLRELHQPRRENR